MTLHNNSQAVEPSAKLGEYNSGIEIFKKTISCRLSCLDIFLRSYYSNAGNPLASPRINDALYWRHDLSEIPGQSENFTISTSTVPE